MSMLDIAHPINLDITIVLPVMIVTVSQMSQGESIKMLLGWAN